MKGKKFGRSRIEKPNNWDKVIYKWKLGTFNLIKCAILVYFHFYIMLYFKNPHRIFSKNI